MTILKSVRQCFCTYSMLLHSPQPCPIFPRNVDADTRFRHNHLGYQSPVICSRLDSCPLRIFMMLFKFTSLPYRCHEIPWVMPRCFSLA